MTDITLDPRPARRFDLARLRDLLIRPRDAFREMAAESRPTWLTPMLVLTITAILVVIVSGYLRTRAAMMGEIQLPQDWEFWSPEMQNNYMQAQQATQGPVFMYIMPMIGSLTGLWLGWLLLAALLHFGSTLLGGRGSMQTALNIVAWASLPFAIRDLLRVVFMLTAGRTISSPGLSGFLTTPGFFTQFLTRIDIFLLWQMILLIIGFGIADNLSRRKSAAGVIVVILLVLLAQAGLGALTSSFGGLAVQRPFF
ncbi:MAG TPA: Yip1 family protein [Anaerolineales bacterium]|nr:Yip1 family protein [Anaerolineales bacterium]